MRSVEIHPYPPPMVLRVLGIRHQLKVYSNYVRSGSGQYVTKW